MGILSRFTDIMSANANSLLSNADAGNTDMLLGKYLKDAKDSLAQVKAEEAAVKAKETRLARELADNEAECNKYKNYAIAAIKSGNDNDARKFLTYKISLEEAREDLSTQYTRAKGESEKMGQLLKKLSGDINAPLPQRENLNPYSAKNSDIFGTHKAPVNASVATTVAEQVSTPDTVTKPDTDAKRSWLLCASHLRTAMFLIGMSSTLFDELSKKAVSKDMAPSIGVENDHEANGHKLFWFLEGLCDKNYIAYHELNSECMEIAASLSRSAAQIGLPPIQAGLLEEHPMRPDPNSPTGESEILGGRAAVYIAEKVDYWRVYLIYNGGGGFYLGVVSLLNAAAFVKKMSDWFAQFNNDYSIDLLGEKE